LGADEFVDYRSQRFEEVLDKVDLVLDTIGGDTQERSFSLLRAGSRLVSVVATPNPDKLAALGASGGLFMVQPNREQLTRIGELIDSQKVRVLVDSVFKLSDARAAHDKSQTGRAKGKIVLEVVAD
jgi:NADPH:quinone reductase-like Zn-dependent oxidoreductase